VRDGGVDGREEERKRGREEERASVEAFLYSQEAT